MTCALRSIWAEGRRRLGLPRRPGTAVTTCPGLPSLDKCELCLPRLDTSPKLSLRWTHQLGIYTRRPHPEVGGSDDWELCVCQRRNHLPKVQSKIAPCVLAHRSPRHDEVLCSWANPAGPRGPRDDTIVSIRRLHDVVPARVFTHHSKTAKNCHCLLQQPCSS